MTAIAQFHYGPARRQQQACHLSGVVHGLLRDRELPDIAAWEVHVPYDGEPYVRGQLSVTYTDCEARQQLGRVLACLDAARIEETRARDDTYTLVEAIGTYQGADIRVWAHVDHAKGGARR